MENKQTAMFTSEQMTGSGQTNMIDLINNSEDRVAHLRTLPHRFHTDAGHGWLEVQHLDLIILDIEGLISGCSYRDGDKAYLEEDVDAGIYINALFGEYINRTPEQSQKAMQWSEMMQNYHTDSESFIRSLKCFK